MKKRRITANLLPDEIESLCHMANLAGITKDHEGQSDVTPTLIRKIAREPLRTLELLYKALKAEEKAKEKRNV